ncbi:MAG TPA: hypothetical protein VGQ55_07685, partial [Pyrinomonadaceae bacterium]|nr:hypothetical protein [Pyrinomonadaceae bacterium]
MPSIFDHDLAKYFPELLKFESTPEMERSDLYAKIKPEVERILNAVVQENLSDFSVSSVSSVVSGFQKARTTEHTGRSESISVLAWNIERGIVFDGIVYALRNHEQLKGKDVLLLTELDYGMVRSGNRFVVRELAQALALNYAFAPVYV